MAARQRFTIWSTLPAAAVAVVVAGWLAVRARVADPNPASTTPAGVQTAPSPDRARLPDVRPGNPMELQQLSQRVKAAAITRASGPTDAARAAAPSEALPPDEPALMAKLHALGEMDPELTIRLAREGNQRNPNSPDAPERAWMLVKAMVNLNHFDDARAEAAIMVEKYRGTSWATDIERHLQIHPRPVRDEPAP